MWDYGMLDYQPLFNKWKAHISKHQYRNFDNLSIWNKSWLRAQKFL